VPEVPGEDVNNTNSLYVSRLDRSRYRVGVAEQRSQCQASLEVIVGFGEGLVDVLCHDCTGGHDVCKVNEKHYKVMNNECIIKSYLSIKFKPFYHIIVP